MKNWYTIEELKTWLMKNNYSEAIADELAPFLVKNYNKAFKKGRETLSNKICELEDKFESEHKIFNESYVLGVRDTFTKIRKL